MEELGTGNVWKTSMPGEETQAGNRVSWLVRQAESFGKGNSLQRLVWKQRAGWFGKGRKIGAQGHQLGRMAAKAGRKK